MLARKTDQRLEPVERQGKEEGQIKHRHLPAQKSRPDARPGQNQAAAAHHLVDGQRGEGKPDRLGKKPDAIAADGHEIQRGGKGEAQQQPDGHVAVDFKPLENLPPQPHRKRKGDGREKHEAGKIDPEQRHEGQGDDRRDGRKHHEDLVLEPPAIAVETGRCVQPPVKKRFGQKRITVRAGVLDNGVERQSPRQRQRHQRGNGKQNAHGVDAAEHNRGPQGFSPCGLWQRSV